MSPLDPMHCACLIVDLQNAFLQPSGLIEVPNGSHIFGPLGSLVGVFRKVGVQLIWTQSSHALSSRAYRELCPSHFPGGAAVLRPGRWQFEYHPEALAMQSSSEDWFVEKNRYSAFIGTPLESRLLSHGIDTLFFTGVMTNICVESSIRDAFQQGFRCFLVSDCTATMTPELQRASESVIAAAFGYVIDTDGARNMF